MVILTILHNLFITSEERHKLVSGESVETVGISLPVWAAGKSKTTEPASEVLCKYILTNQEEPNNIKIEDGGYQINLPQAHRDWKPPELDDNVWRSLTKRQREKWYKNFPADIVLPSSLLDVSEGGSEYIRFKEHNKIFQDDECLEIIHYVCIADFKILRESSTRLQAESHTDIN